MHNQKRNLNIRAVYSILDRFVGMTNPDMWKMIIAEHNIIQNLDAILGKQIELKLRLLADGGLAGHSRNT